MTLFQVCTLGSIFCNAKLDYLPWADLGTQRLESEIRLVTSGGLVMQHFISHNTN